MNDPGRRAVVLVGNPAAPYSRSLRIARALVSAGHAVEIVAVAGEGIPDAEVDGEVRIRRYQASGPYASMAATYRDPHAAGASLGRRWPSPLRVARRVAAVARRWLFWPHTVRGWWATLERELEPADLYHACGSLTVAPALAARARDRRAGRRSVVVYDAVDDVFGGNSVLGMPAPVRAWHGRTERRWARAADARTTVNEELAERLARRWGTPQPLVLPNYPEPWRAPGGSPPNRIREELGLPSTVRIVLFQGRLGPNLGLDAAAEAVLRVPDAVLVLIGFGRWAEKCRARDRDPRFAGRHVTLPPKHPDELPWWTASADLSLVPLPPVSLNQRLSTPNKFWESLAAGTPVVVGRDLEVMRRIVEADHLGALADPADPADLARAIRAILDLPAAEIEAMRRRCLAVSRERYAWPVAVGPYLELVDRLGRPSRS